MALEYWREHWETMDDGGVNNGILITKSSICADKRKARKSNTSKCIAPNDKITRVGSGEKWGEHDKKSSPRGSHPYVDAKRQQTVQPGRVDCDETATHNRQRSQANRHRLEELSDPSIDTSTMRRGNASPILFKKTRTRRQRETQAWIH